MHLVFELKRICIYSERQLTFTGPSNIMFFAIVKVLVYLLDGLSFH